MRSVAIAAVLIAVMGCGGEVEVAASTTGSPATSGSTGGVGLSTSAGGSHAQGGDRASTGGRNAQGAGGANTGGRNGQGGDGANTGGANGQGGDGGNANTCADGSEELGVAYFGRADIVFCAAPNGTLPTKAEGAALCGAGWSLCTAVQWVARNDTCADDADFAAWLDEGSQCFATVLGGNSPETCEADTVLEQGSEAGPGTCTHTVVASGNPFSMHGGDGNGIGYYCTAPGWSADGECGAVCCAL